jgi:hypothetical protein
VSHPVKYLDHNNHRESRASMVCEALHAVDC